MARCREEIRDGNAYELCLTGRFECGYDGDAVALLRRRKHRYEKPLALMVPDLDAAAALCEGAYLGLAWLGDLGANVPLTWAAFYGAFAVYAWTAWRLLRRPAGSVRQLLAAALLFRLTLLPTAPTLSDDI